ncbi:hypothetical protein, partial [Xenorhabdus sp. Sc-CR9]|uniref:hypothetical protein n=1 Tax=Xenorhabdus sp. Sc-CR9 TaxID=2584468 RepID=UPI001F1999B1
GCEAAYLTLSSVSVKPYFSRLFTLSSRQICVFVVTTDAHYREFYAADNSFFSIFFRSRFFYSKRWNSHQKGCF